MLMHTHVLVVVVKKELNFKETTHNVILMIIAMAFFTISAAFYYIGRGNKCT